MSGGDSVVSVLLGAAGVDATKCYDP
jgi:hypothetical protein